MKLESSYVGESSIGMGHFQSQLAALTIQIQDIDKGKENHENVWCTNCRTKGHHKNEHPMLQPYLNIVALNPLGPWCEICKTMGHHLHNCILMQKYQRTVRNLFHNFCKLVGHDEKEFHAFDLMRECTVDAYKFQGEELEGGFSLHNTPIGGYHQGERGGLRGSGRGGFCRRRGPIICYNCNKPRHLDRDYLNPYTTCTYCRVLDHVMEDFPQLIAKWQEKTNANVQMIVTKECDDTHKVASVTHGRTRTGSDVTDQGNRIHQWVRTVADHTPLFDPRKEKETYQQERI
jgi:hypothetical protein